MTAKNTFIGFIIGLGATLSATAGELGRIRALLPENTDIAQIQSALLRGASEQEAEEMAKQNYLIADFNRDGFSDIVVLAEQNPTLVDFRTEKPCEKYDPGVCELNFGDRSFNVYLGQSDGGHRLDFSNRGIVLRADEGGVFGDPLEGLSRNAKGSIRLNFYGGSAWRWAYTWTIQYRKNDFYLVGRTSMSLWTGDLRFESKDINLITGGVIEKRSKGEGHPTLRKKYKVKTQPLRKARDLAGGFEP